MAENNFGFEEFETFFIGGILFMIEKFQVGSEGFLNLHKNFMNCFSSKKGEEEAT
jgi:hypothetical protein